MGLEPEVVLNQKWASLSVGCAFTCFQVAMYVYVYMCMCICNCRTSMGLEPAVVLSQ